MLLLYTVTLSLCLLLKLNDDDDDDDVFASLLRLISGSRGKKSPGETSLPRRGEVRICSDEEENRGWWSRCSVCRHEYDTLLRV